MYKAKHYVRIGRTVYKKGDVIPENIPEERLAFLIKKESVYECTGSDAFQEELTPESDADPKDEENAQEIQEKDLEEPDEDAEAPEIDVMAGIVQEEKAPEKPARSRKPKGDKAK